MRGESRRFLGGPSLRDGHSLRLYRRAAHPYLVEALLAHLPRRDNRIARLRRIRRARTLQRLYGCLCTLNRNLEPVRHINVADKISFSENAITAMHISPESDISQTSTRHVAENSFGRSG